MSSIYLYQEVHGIVERRHRKIKFIYIHKLYFAIYIYIKFILRFQRSTLPWTSPRRDGGFVRGSGGDGSSINVLVGSA